MWLDDTLPSFAGRDDQEVAPEESTAVHFSLSNNLRGILAVE